MDTRKKKSAVEIAHKRISRAIYLGEMTPRGTLPSATDLSREIGVSRPSVLEALRILAHEGAVQINRGRTGVEVLPAMPANLKKRIGWLDENREAILEMVFVREIIEPGIAQIVAAEKLPIKVRRELEETLSKLAVGPQESVSELSAREMGLRALDHQFHLQLARATKMPILIEIATEARAWVAPLFEILDWPLHRHAESYQEHLRIFEAIVKRDPRAAAARVREHLSSSSERIKRLLSDTGRWKLAKAELVKNAI